LRLEPGGCTGVTSRIGFPRPAGAFNRGATAQRRTTAEELIARLRARDLI